MEKIHTIRFFYHTLLRIFFLAILSDWNNLLFSGWTKWNSSLPVVKSRKFKDCHRNSVRGNYFLFFILYHHYKKSLEYISWWWWLMMTLEIAWFFFNFVSLSLWVSMKINLQHFFSFCFCCFHTHTNTLEMNEMKYLIIIHHNTSSMQKKNSIHFQYIKTFFSDSETRKFQIFSS